MIYFLFDLMLGSFMAVITIIILLCGFYGVCNIVKWIADFFRKR